MVTRKFLMTVGLFGLATALVALSVLLGSGSASTSYASTLSGIAQTTPTTTGGTPPPDIGRCIDEILLGDWYECEYEGTVVLDPEVFPGGCDDYVNEKWKSEGCDNAKVEARLCPRVQFPAYVRNLTLPRLPHIRPRNPAARYHPIFNPLPRYLSLSNTGRPYHPAYNGLVLKSGCP